GEPSLGQRKDVPLDELVLVLRCDGCLAERLVALGGVLRVAPVAELVFPRQAAGLVVVIARGAVVLAGRALGPVVGARLELGRAGQQRSRQQEAKTGRETVPVHRCFPHLSPLRRLYFFKTSRSRSCGSAITLWPSRPTIVSAATIALMIASS